MRIDEQGNAGPGSPVPVSSLPAPLPGEDEDDQY